jgi:hypothetical protein
MEKNKTNSAISAKAIAILVVVAFSFSYVIINDLWRPQYQQFLVLGQVQDDKSTTTE